MDSMETGLSGVIAPVDEGVAAVAHAADDANQIVAAAIQSVPQAIQDLPLPQLPEDMAPIEAPEFVLARKISEDSHNGAAVPAGLSGLGGGAGAPEAHSVLGGAPTDVSSLLGGADTAISHAVAQANTAAQGALAQANGVLGGALGGGAAQAAQAGQQAASALPSVSMPALPADPVAALMSGLALPALPGVDQLFKPILDLLSSFGTGILGALDPTKIISASSEIIETAMQVGKGSMATVEQVWEGQAARSAQAASQEATAQGQETSKRGFDISGLTEAAASTVQTGNGQLVGVASSFATQAVALAPVIFTPPAQTALIATATQHLGNAVGIVNATRGDLAGKTAELNGMVAQLLGQSGLPAPEEVAQAAIQNIGEPLLNEAQDSATKSAGIGSDSSYSPQLGSNSPTTPQSAGHGSGTGTGVLGPLGTARTGGGSGARVGGGGGSGAGAGSGSSAKLGVGTPGATVSPLRGATGIPGASMGTGAMGGSTGTAGSGNSFMGGPGAAAGQRGGEDDQHSRTVAPYQSRTGNDDLTGPLGESTPDVIGAPHSDELLSDYEQDQF
ncbi:hypothetical protein [Nocardia bovistercoris]|uniref:Uncharacterized protein n=1 Tax=Nocardia bovistercoris TaxID=2785916 RepID=A0A931MYF0_9NOCA|nr:hypothetical protein [Nocardia bovistercoris]MBH0774935.1 hypothetical protein [Nocardia bovistercoris]